MLLSVLWALLALGCGDQSTEIPEQDLPQWTLPDPSNSQSSRTTADGGDGGEDPPSSPPGIEWDRSGSESSSSNAAQESEGGDSRTDPPDDGFYGEDIPYFPLPSSLGEGFVEISGPIVHSPLMEIEKGEIPHEQPPDRTFGLFADLDGDGRSEVIVDGTSCCQGQEKSGPLPYRMSEVTGEMELAPDLMGLFPDSIHGSLIGWIDLNGDGYEDIITSFGKQMFFLRDSETGGWHPPFLLNHPTLGQPLMTNGAVWVADLDQNGLLDILVGDALCMEGSGVVMGVLQLTPGFFVSKPSMFDSAMPMGDPYAVWAGPAGPVGEYIIGAFGRSCDQTNPHTAFLRRAEWDSEGYPIFEEFDPTPLDSPYKKHSLQSFGPLSQVNPMGATFGDMSLDGLIDSVVTHTNPPSTHWTRRGLPSQARFGVFQAQSQWPFNDQSNWSNVGPPEGLDNLHMIPWGIALVDVNRDGMGDMIAVHGPDSTGLMDPKFWVGPQHTTLSLATSLLRFEDATPMSGLDVEGHWRSLTIGDLEGDGDVDVIIGGLGEQPRVFENRCETDGYGLSIRLKGQFSNSAGLGATVSVESDLLATGRKHLVGHISSPEAISDPLIFPAIGSTPTSGKVTVAWPSGYVQIVSGLSAGTLHVIEEPELVTFDPPSRSLPVNSTTPMLVSITPRTPLGEVADTATVTLLSSDPEVSVGTPVQEDGTWTFPLTPPATPGSSTIEIQIDGKAFLIRPRLRWTNAIDEP